MNSGEREHADDRSRDDAVRVSGQLAVLLPGRGVFAELLDVALRAADAQMTRMRSGRESELPTGSGTGVGTDVVVDVGEVADALHLRLEGVYGHPDRQSFVSMPPLGELMRMLTETVVRASTAPTSSSSSSALSAESVDLAGLYLYLFLARPRTDAPALPGRDVPGGVGRRVLAAFAAGDLDAGEAFAVSQALMFDSLTRSRLRELLDIASSFPAATEVDPGERMPEHVWARSLRTIAALQREREQDDPETDPETDAGAAP